MSRDFYGDCCLCGQRIMRQRDAGTNLASPLHRECAARCGLTEFFVKRKNHDAASTGVFAQTARDAAEQYYWHAGDHVMPGDVMTFEVVRPAAARDGYGCFHVTLEVHARVREV